MEGDNLAELLLPTKNLNEDMEFFKSVGFRLTSIYPTDKPVIARMEGHRMAIRLDGEHHPNDSPVVINLLSDNPPNGKGELIAPNGTVLRLLPKSFKLATPITQHKFLVTKLKGSGSNWTEGRAGMRYRDLIPGRLGGAIVASHISIPNGGPVPDMVHYHTVKFQLIYCYKGWVKVVYEDQGPPFVLEQGDCVTQPPEIRHKVLESSKDAEVIEIGVPTHHMTTMDHQLSLPTSTYNPQRVFNGQTFCHYKSKHSSSDDAKELYDGGKFQVQDTGVGSATRGVASVHIVKISENAVIRVIRVDSDIDIYFGFVLSGQATLCADGEGTHPLEAGDAYVIPPGLQYHLRDVSGELELLLVCLPGLDSPI